VPDEIPLAEKLRAWRQEGAPGLMRRKGTTDKRQITNEDTGKPAGHYTHHWDGRVDATVTPPTVRRKLTIAD
jgi:hypothetical protein